jgi:hypothetical protein
MKKTLITLLMVLLCAMLIISCNDDASSSSPKPTYVVSFQLGEGTSTGTGSDFDAQDVVEGEKAKKPATNPKANGKFKTFAFWSADDGATEFKFDETPITKDIVLKAIYKEYEAGDIVNYGTYPQAYAIESLRNKAITWKILSVDKTNSRMLVISENVLDASGTYLDFTSYSGSDIQRYLNGDFITTYGLGDVSIVAVNATAENITFGSGNDKVFLISKSEAENTSYFANAAARVATYNGRARQWNLRSICSGNFTSPYAVMTDGAIQGYSYATLRPAMWVNL